MFKFNGGSSGEVFFTRQCTVRKEAKDLGYSSALQAEIRSTSTLTELGFSAMPKIVNSSLQVENTYLEMEFVPGHTLNSVDNPDVVLIGKLAKALASLHRLGWIHGDLHGSNVMINAWGEIKFIDFAYAEEDTGSERFGDINTITMTFTLVQAELFKSIYHSYMK